MAQVVIDLNVRTGNNLTFAALEDVSGSVAPGAAVDVIEPESDLIGSATVARIDVIKGLIYLAVDWASLRARTVGESQEGEEPSAVVTKPCGSFHPLRRCAMSERNGEIAHIAADLRAIYFGGPLIATKMRFDELPDGERARWVAVAEAACLLTNPLAEEPRQ